VENNREGVAALQHEGAHGLSSGRALRAVPLADVTVLADQFLMVMQEMSERFKVRQTASA
jgi:hypothetical protein